MRGLQSDIVTELERVDGGGKKFLHDSWSRAEGGGGLSCVLQQGNVFEKAGVNVSVVHGTLSAQSAQQMRARGKDMPDDGRPQRFFATGISMVLHPRNPMAPTVHLNYRYFEIVGDDGQPKHWWFGGGMSSWASSS